MSSLTSSRTVIQQTDPIVNNTNVPTKENVRRLFKRRMLLTRNVPLPIAKIIHAMTIKIIPNLFVRKISVKCVKAMETACCGNSVPVTTGITQTIESPQAHPPIVLKNKPLKPVKAPMTDAMLSLLLKKPLMYCHNHRDCNCNPAACNRCGQNYHADHCDHSMKL